MTEVSSRESVGGNNPPDMTVTATEVMKDLSGWMAENPVIQTEEAAREGKVYLDRAKLCLKDLDDERDGKVRPLNEQVKEINGRYRVSKEPLEAVLFQLQSRLSAYLQDEKRKREEAAREAARIAAAAEQRARDAEKAEQDAIGSANSGELGIDIAAHVSDADGAFREYEKATHQAQIAERDTKVKVGGGFSRAIGLRQKETLVVADLDRAIKAIGATVDIAEAIIKSARAYRKLNGKLPDGVVAEIREEV